MTTRRKYGVHPAMSSVYKKGDIFEEEGSFKTVRFQSDNGFVIGVFSPKKSEDIVCKGEVPGFVIGAPFSITGKVIEDATWGIQVNISEARAIQPQGKTEVVAFLGSGAVDGIGPVIARRIYAAFGDETLDILENNPMKLVEVPGIGRKNVEKIARSLPNTLKYREIIGWLAGFGISTCTINRLIKEYGERTKTVIEDNPYVLCKVRGFAFTRADSIAMKMGIEIHDTKRLYAGLVATLRYACNAYGHTLMPRSMLLKEAESKLKTFDKKAVEASLNALIKDGKLMEDEDGIHLPALYKAESSIKASLLRASQKSMLLPRDDVSKILSERKKASNIAFTEEQDKAVDNAFSHSLSVLTGGAGTGKTSVCRMMVEVANTAEIPVCLISPTGRAAKHLSETCGIPGYTMHRALSIGVKEEKTDEFFDDGEASVFQSKAQTEAVEHFEAAQLVIADEASMIDTEMAAILFKACKKKHLVLVGDPNQLPSVGPGRILADIIASGSGNLTSLTKIFRQSEGSPVISAATDVENGRTPCYEPGVRFFECANADVQKTLSDKVLPMVSGLGYEDFMVISPIKKTPFSGVNALNDFFRPVCNPKYRTPENEKLDFLLQEGDWVSQKRNNYNLDIFNGDIGKVEYVDGDGTVGVLFAGSDSIIEFEKNEVQDNLMLSYASTVHRQQGSQAPLVIIVMTSSQFALLNRNLLYTAITRAEESLILIGDARAFAMAAKNTKEDKRMTGLISLSSKNHKC